VELRGINGERFTAEGEMNATINGLSPATQYSLTLTFIFTGDLGPPTIGPNVTTLDDSKSHDQSHDRSHDCRVSYSACVCVLIWPSLCVCASVCVCVCAVVVSWHGEWYTFLHSKQSFHMCRAAVSELGQFIYMYCVFHSSVPITEQAS
jgi:hypothetical protein